VSTGRLAGAPSRLKLQLRLASLEPPTVARRGAAPDAGLAGSYSIEYKGWPVCDHSRMRAYSEDLRKKIVAAIGRGMSKAQAARLFDVSLSSVKRYSRMAREGGSLEPRKSPGRSRKAGEKARVLLEKDVEERPSATISQRRRFLEHITDTTLSDSTVRRLMKRLGFSQKTDYGGARTRRVLEVRLEGHDRERARPKAVGVRGRDGHQHFAFCVVRLGSQRRAGTLLGASQQGPNTTLLSSMTLEGMGSSLAVEGATTARRSSRLTSSGFSPRAWKADR
jgi:transposase